MYRSVAATPEYAAARVPDPQPARPRRRARALVRRVRIFHAGGSSPGPGHLRVPSRDCRHVTEEVPPLLPQARSDTYVTNLTSRMTSTTAWTVRHRWRATSPKPSR